MQASVKAAQEGYDAMIGFIPGENDSESKFDVDFLKKALKENKFVGIKAGLDYNNLETHNKLE